MAGGQERILKERIRSVSATKKITRAMELIAASRIVKAQARVTAAVPYSEQITEVVKDLAAVLHGAGFFGPVHVEFREDSRDGVLRPIEINPRYWGSLALAHHAGVPFPALHARLALGERPRPVLEYEVGRRCRWLLFGDLQVGLQFAVNGYQHALCGAFVELLPRHLS